jgi:SAM-dependent methyltransferase
MPGTDSAAVEFLHQVYADLRLNEGLLFPPAATPTDDTIGYWQAIGDWLSLAARMDADRIFFVGDDPVLVFSAVPDDASEREIIKTYRQAWSLARPQCLFLATADELKVYDLSQPPPQTSEEWRGLPLQVLQRTADVAESLSNFQRNRVESGTIFGDSRLGGVDRRADKQLINDVDIIARRLRESDLSPALAHGLIERVILIRYLEDRKVITRDYLLDIASSHSGWGSLQPDEDGPVIFGADSLFARFLRNKTLTYDIFQRLAQVFNGDLFLVDDIEFEQVTGEHLDLIFRMLTGDTHSFRDKLFLWAYDFSVVPISLISSMYEHFYHATQMADGNEDSKGTHYTPPELVEYVLSKVLTPQVLDRKPRILDPACGSGTFLVEAYRTIVRHETTKYGRLPSSKRLKEYLLTRIAGIDLNREAIRLSAFSLYLAYLNYQTPQDIREAGPLPRLIYHQEQTVYAPLVVNNAFTPTASELDEKLFDAGTASLSNLPWPSNAFDVLVGNPPWTPPPKDISVTAERWAKKRGYPFGDRSPSQLFLWRTLDLLKPDGIAAMLVAATVIYNSKSNGFRRSWLEQVAIDEVVNFTQVRRIFFTKSVAPFCLIKYRKSEGEESPRHFVYLAVRPSQPLKATRAMAYGHIDRRLVRQESVRRRDYLWKVYAWGSHHDEALMTRLDQERQLSQILADTDFKGGYGYQLGSDKPNAILRRLPSLRTFEPWGPVDPAWLEPQPEGVKRQPDQRLYVGMRLLIRRGVKVGFGPYVRLEDSPLTYRHHIYGIPLAGIPPWQAKILFGTILSSLGRYRLFMTSGAWGVWHDSIVSRDLLCLPIRLGDQGDPTTVEICTLVDEIRAWTPAERLDVDERATPSELLRQLDRHVNQLFELEPAEIDLIEDWREFSLAFDSVGTAPLSGSADWLSHTNDSDTVRLPNPISKYVQIFVDKWNRELGRAAELRWEVIGTASSPTIAVVFRAVERSSQLDSEGFDSGLAELEEWLTVLARLGENMPTDMSRSMVTEGIVRVVGGDYFVIVKRNENRLWSASAAREDFEATLLSAMRLETQ